jgi:hypothetical protein
VSINLMPEPARRRESVHSRAVYRFHPLFADATFRYLYGDDDTDMGADHDQRAGRIATGETENGDLPQPGCLDAAASLTFPDMLRRELDEPLIQLVQRAQEVASTQGRLRGLLHANQMITAIWGCQRC